MILVLAMFICSVLSTFGFFRDRHRRYHFELLCYMFFGSLLMWSVDLAVAVAEDGVEAFQPGAAEIVDDLKLSLSVIVAAVAIWAVYLKLKMVRTDDSAVA